MEEENFLGGGFPPFCYRLSKPVGLQYRKQQLFKELDGETRRRPATVSRSVTPISIRKKWNPDLFETLNIRRSLGISEDVPLVIYAGPILLSETSAAPGENHPEDVA